MGIRKIVVQGDDILTKKCRPVTEFNQKLWDLLDDMTETLTEVGGAGLAAPQVGILRRIAVVADDDDSMIELVNPEILSASGEQRAPEGCLSIPGKFGMVTRPNVVKVRAQNRKGDWFEVEREEYTARCFCHEIEHLDGHLYTEHIDRFLTDEEVEAYYEEREN